MLTETEFLNAIRENILEIIDTAEDDEDAQEQLAAYEALLEDPERMRALLIELSGNLPPEAAPARLGLQQLTVIETLREKVRRLARRKYSAR